MNASNNVNCKARPRTSKPRGICRYYTTERGCFNGKRCKFLHGNPAEESTLLTPYDQSKVCKYFAKGYCKRGEHCWFRHESPDPSKDCGLGPMSRLARQRLPEDEDVCCICLERPLTYGLLADCSHVFCLECIRRWREPVGKSMDVTESGVNKKCPLCRAPSRFVTPSSHFYRHDDSGKASTTDLYKSSMARTRCKYFEASKKRGSDSRLPSPFCPFGKDCFYKHLNNDGTQYIFLTGVETNLRRYLKNPNLLSWETPTVESPVGQRMEAELTLPENTPRDQEHPLPIPFTRAEIDSILSYLDEFPVPFRSRNQRNELSGTNEIALSSPARLLFQLIEEARAILPNTPPLGSEDEDATPDEESEVLPSEPTPTPAELVNELNAHESPLDIVVRLMSPERPNSLPHSPSHQEQLHTSSSPPHTVINSSRFSTVISRPQEDIQPSEEMLATQDFPPSSTPPEEKSSELHPDITAGISRRGAEDKLETENDSLTLPISPGFQSSQSLASPPEFTTDGRGRVIATNTDDNLQRLYELQSSLARLLPTP